MLCLARIEMSEPSVDSCKCFCLRMISSHFGVSSHNILDTFMRSHSNIDDITESSSKAQATKVDPIW